MNRTVVEITAINEKFYIIPVYINCNKWMDDFAELYNFLLELGRENIMLIGDCKARVGASQLLQVEPEFVPASICDERSACDTTVDSKGRKFIEMCETIGLTLLNGRMPSPL